MAFSNDGASTPRDRFGFLSAMVDPDSSVADDKPGATREFVENQVLAPVNALQKKVEQAASFVKSPHPLQTVSPNKLANQVLRDCTQTLIATVRGKDFGLQKSSENSAPAADSTSSVPDHHTGPTTPRFG